MLFIAAIRPAMAGTDRKSKPITINQQLTEGQKKSYSTSARDLLAQATEAIPVPVTGIKLNRTENRLELILETSTQQRLQPLILPEGKNLIIDLLDATLALPEEEFQATNPAEGIAEVTVKPLDATSIRVTITGEETVPTAAVIPSQENLVLRITPEKTAQTEAEEDNYFVPDGTTATRTDTPLRDIPQSIQIVPQQVIEDQQAIQLEDVIRNVSGVSTGDSFGGTTERFVIRGFAQDTTLINGFRQGAFGQGFPSLETLERVEVLKGPASILYGNLEPGGVINLVTKKPLAEPFAETAVKLGNFGFFQAGFDFSGPINSKETLLYRLNTIFEVSDGW
ncbi:TonB-dependent receptor plug domain-containing protein [Pleurocapsales cyanobacterium LEGE 06147]|nr:TonB-dependent receptor plug domain-containing protein [Pleurocapsales cyanobacterium LEGE 06147]